MKKLYPLIVTAIISSCAFAQAPEKMGFQAVVRDASNSLVTSSAIGMQISILQDSPSGTAVYVETQTPISNANGLVSLEIGNGTIISGTFSSINWWDGPYFVKTETDPSGGISYSITSTSQLISTPYALYAKKSGTATTAFTANTAGTASSLTVTGDSLVFAGSSPTTWTDLDLSSVVGQNFASVTLKITNLSGTLATPLIFRQNGDLDEYSVFSGGVNSSNTGYNGVDQAIIYTDSNGIIEWKGNEEVPVKIEVVAFIE